MLAALYDVGVPTINYHIRKIFEDGELQEFLVIRNFRITAADGKSYRAKHYSLQMILAVGFKVDSERAVQFRKWVNQIATTYTIKGWVMDDARLKRGGALTDKYFEEQLERVREIRASERKFYHKITDLYATAIDYDRTALATRRFYASVQNKMHYAVHGKTAAELIVVRADSRRRNMGLTTWEDAPDGKIRRSDVSVAKNYLSETEMRELNRFIEMFEFGQLKDAGTVTAEAAKLHAETEFEKYRIVQDRLFVSDYDRFLLELEDQVKRREKGDAADE